MKNNKMIADKCFQIIKMNGVMRIRELILYVKRIKPKKLQAVLDKDNRFRKMFNGYGLLVWGIKKGVSI